MIWVLVLVVVGTGMGLAYVYAHLSPAPAPHEFKPEVGPIAKIYPLAPPRAHELLEQAARSLSGMSVAHRSTTALLINVRPNWRRLDDERGMVIMCKVQRHESGQALVTLHAQRKISWLSNMAGARLGLASAERQLRQRVRDLSART